VAARAMICNLSAFFRFGLSSDPAADVTLDDEIEFQRLYLAIEHARFGDRLHVAFEIPDELGGIMVPALLLQPLVENAVKHGVAQSSASVTITVSAVAIGSAMHLSVYDHCNEPKSPSLNPAASTGIGLSNVRSRIETRYGPAASLKARPHEGGWISELILPHPQENQHD
jgi:two-component system, LytTR family, sensor kinase